MSSETALCYAWVNSTLQADSALMAAATGGVWQGAADSGTQPPFVVYARQSGVDVMTSNAIRLWASMLLQIKLLGPTANYAALVTGANRIDALFGSVRDVGLASGGILSCYREQEFAMNEVVAGVAWLSLGGLYRINVQGQ